MYNESIMKKSTLIILAIGAIVVLGFFYFLSQKNIFKPQVNDFDSCVAAGYPVAYSYPPQCTANGKTYIENIGNELEKSDLIEVDNPRPNQVITSPLEVGGRARGTWFFEANFPVRLYDSTGKEIAVGIAKAQGEWMTEEFVPFRAALTFESLKGDKGELVFEKNNPSDLPENADSLRIPVKFR